MSGLDEDAALVKVSEGLAARFPDVDPAMVRSVVAEARSSFDGPVRDYVPLLVERVSTERLRALDPASSSTGDPGATVGDGASSTGRSQVSSA